MAKEYSKQDIKKAIEQLEKLRNHCLIMSIDAENAEWDKDVKALDLAIESLKPELQITKEIMRAKEKYAPQSRGTIASGALSSVGALLQRGQKRIGGK